MEMITSKQELLERVRQERITWETLVHDVGEARMRVGGAMGAWTFQDVVAHLTTWWQREVMCLEATRYGEQPAPHPSQPDVQVINQWSYQINHYRPPQDIVRAASGVWQQFEDAIAAFDERDLMEPGRFAWLNGDALGPTILHDFVGHFHEEHEPQIRAWLEEVKAREA
jgi:hypothetical protein